MGRQERMVLERQLAKQKITVDRQTLDSMLGSSPMSDAEAEQRKRKRLREEFQAQEDFKRMQKLVTRRNDN